MNYTVISKNEENKTVQVEFDASKEGTCMKKWNFTLQSENDDFKIVDSAIEYSGKGCNGHPQTISALTLNQMAKDINTEGLYNTPCFNKKSCGMILAECIDNIKEIQELKF